MARTKTPKGTAYYRAAGFDKAILVPMSKELHQRLKDFAKKDERTMQTAARRILEGRLLKHNKRG